MQSAFRHIFRAGYELLDGLSIVFRERITEDLKQFTPQTIHSVFPKYLQEIKPFLVKVAPEIADARAKKDIADPDLERFKEYASKIDKLKEYYEELMTILPSFITSTH